MGKELFIKHLDPLTSMGINTSRRGFLPSGRYYGFDEWKDGKLNHINKMGYTDDQDDSHSAAVVVSRHGMVILTESSITGLTPADPASPDQFVVVLGNYKRGDLEPAYVTSPPQSTEPETIELIGTALGTTMFPIGYFKLDNVGSVREWVPYPAPFLARGSLDTSNFALLDRVNRFAKQNFLGVQHLTRTALVPDVGWKDGSWSRLNVSAEKGNIIYADLSGTTTPIKISDIDIYDKDGNIVSQDGANLLIMFMGAPANSVLGYNATKILSQNVSIDKTGSPINSYSCHSLLGIKGLTGGTAESWVEYSQITGHSSAILNLQSRVKSNEQELVHHDDRITQLEGGAWTDIPFTAPADWIVHYIQYIRSNINVRFRISLMSTGTNPAGNITFGDIPNEIMPLEYSAPIVHGTHFASIGFDAGRIGFSFPQVNPSIVFILEDTVIKTF